MPVQVQLAAHSLIVPGEQIHLIARGRCRALLVPRGAEPGDVPPYRVGARVALQRAASEPARGWVNILRVTDVALGELDDDQARELGHRDVYALQAAWLERGVPWDSRARAWMLRIEHDDAAPSRLLHRDSLHGYTDDPRLALRGEPEAVDDFTLAARQRAAHRAEVEAYEQLRAGRARMPLDERLALVLRDADARGVAVGAQRAAIVKQLDIMERRTYSPADRTADAEVRAPDPDDELPRPRRRGGAALERHKRAERERKRPGPLNVHHVDPDHVAPGTAIPRVSGL